VGNACHALGWLSAAEWATCRAMVAFRAAQQKWTV
jgi:hypothetical protein